jgi:hypothetical protein
MPDGSTWQLGALVCGRGEVNTHSASSPRSSISLPPWSSTRSRAISANRAASRAAASSPRVCVNRV